MKSFAMDDTSISLRKLTEAEWRMYMSVNKTIISPGNGLPLIHGQAIIWPSDGLLFFGPL